MSEALGDHTCEAHLERLKEIPEQLPYAEQAEVWCGVALNLAATYGEGKP